MRPALWFFFALICVALVLLTSCVAPPVSGCMRDRGYSPVMVSPDDQLTSATKRQIVTLDLQLINGCSKE